MLVCQFETSPKTADFTDSTGQWHHLAVSWQSSEHGLMLIYMDGLPGGDMWINHSSSESAVNPRKSGMIDHHGFTFIDVECCSLVKENGVLFTMLGTGT